MKGKVSKTVGVYDRPNEDRSKRKSALAAIFLVAAIAMALTAVIFF